MTIIEEDYIELLDCEKTERYYVLYYSDEIYSSDGIYKGKIKYRVFLNSSFNVTSTKVNSDDIYLRNYVRKFPRLEHWVNKAKQDIHRLISEGEIKEFEKSRHGWKRKFRPNKRNFNFEKDKLKIG
jgi:hypothetical protein